MKKTIAFTIVLSLAMIRGVCGRTIAYLGFAAGVFDIPGAYPETVGPILIRISQLVFAAGFIAVGPELYRLGSAVTGNDKKSGAAGRRP
jgi:alkyl sulfatase BDS1-like metallo-beta-lactamase superfamily hydrolase